MKNENKKGGKRPGSGRRPNEVKKEPVTIYTDVSRFGGRDGARMAIYQFLDGQISDTGQKAFIPLDISDADLKWPPRPPKRPKKAGAADAGKSAIVFKETKDGAYDGSKASAALMDDPVNISPIKPRNLDELKALCPFPEKSEERSQWIRTERVKYGI